MPKQSPQSSFPIVVLLSGKGSNLKAILEAIEQKKLHAQVIAVISDKPQAPGLEIARAYNIPNTVIEARNFSSRESFDQALQLEIDKLNAQLIVLAGFMRILSTDFVEHFTGKLINIHPSLLPKFKGLHTHQRALEGGEKTHGCSVHYVSAELDGGPLIAQREFNVSLDDNVDSLLMKVQQLEHRLYPEVIQWIAKEQVSLKHGELYIDPTLLQK